MKEKVFVLVKTYPTLSTKYFELVCTAGINEKGEWRRIYPIPFRQLNEIEKYKKYQWIEVDIKKDNSDNRPESFKLLSDSKIEILSKIGTDKDKSWRSRKEIIFANKKNIFVYLIGGEYESYLE